MYQSRGLFVIDSVVKFFEIVQIVYKFFIECLCKKYENISFYYIVSVLKNEMYVERLILLVKLIKRKENGK